MSCVDMLKRQMHQRSLVRLWWHRSLGGTVFFVYLNITLLILYLTYLHNCVSRGVFPVLFLSQERGRLAFNRFRLFLERRYKDRNRHSAKEGTSEPITFSLEGWSVEVIIFLKMLHGDF